MTELSDSSVYFIEPINSDVKLRKFMNFDTNEIIRLAPTFFVYLLSEIVDRYL
uniref:Uncharacterized protein n=1 Tax=Anguilla anguilla TaxID=7936 RepID=A0A0E9PX34_ANGAN